jgi:flagellin
MKIHFGPTNNSAEDYYYINIGSATAGALGLNSLNIASQSTAQQALTTITNAIVSKDTIRANIGAYSNRLSNTISQLSIQAENTQAAESRVRDVDVALEMTNFVNNQIKSQAAIAMLAQANTIPQMALTLIGG